MTLQPSDSILRRFFAGIAESIFETELGVADPPLIDYLSDLLCRFVRLDTSERRAASAVRPVQEVARLATEATQRIGPARRDSHRYLGDFTLFWTGMYPEALRRASAEAGVDSYASFCQHGKRAYWIASRIEADSPAAGDDLPPADVLERLSHEFEMCAYGLREVRRQWDRPGVDDSSPPLLWG